MEEEVVEAGGVAAADEVAPTAGDMDLLWVELVDPLGEGGGLADAAAVTFVDDAVLLVKLDEEVVVVSLVSEAEAAAAAEDVEPSGPLGAVWKEKKTKKC